MIKAIETRYNGYHFRSRLEARWAVFFDELGVRYEYEKDGYDLGDQGRYLPDFWLPDLRTWFEIKPLSEKPYVPKVYCAGRIGYHNSDWRKEYGAHVYATLDDMRKDEGMGMFSLRKHGGIDYAGPHLIDPGEQGHGIGFGLVFGHADDRRELLDTCLQQIKDADIVIAMLDDNEAHGTLVEMGYAKALGKNVWVGIAGPFVDQSEYWFALQLADQIFYADQPRQIMAQAFPWPPVEIAKVSALLQDKDTRDAFVAYGDPVDDTLHWCGYGLRGQWFTLIGSFIRMSVANRDTNPIVVSPAYAERIRAAATAARSARFEHGRNGAQ